jgi:hypothetical protein
MLSKRAREDRPCWLRMRRACTQQGNLPLPVPRPNQPVLETQAVSVTTAVLEYGSCEDLYLGQLPGSLLGIGSHNELREALRQSS